MADYQLITYNFHLSKSWGKIKAKTKEIRNNNSMTRPQKETKDCIL